MKICRKFLKTWDTIKLFWLYRTILTLTYTQTCKFLANLSWEQSLFEKWSAEGKHCQNWTLKMFRQFFKTLDVTKFLYFIEQCSLYRMGKSANFSEMWFEKYLRKSATKDITKNKIFRIRRNFLNILDLIALAYFIKQWSLYFRVNRARF